MSVTCPADPIKPYGDHIEAAHDEPFIPVYARRGKARGGQGKIRTWMILTPVAVLFLGGIGTMLIMSGGEEASAPLAEPAATAPVLPVPPAQTEAAAAPLTSASTPAPVVAETPVVREATPLRRVTPAPARRAATPRAQAPTVAPVVAPRVAPPEAPAGPQPYTAAPSAPPTTTLNTTPVAPATPVVPAPPPPIMIEPVG